MNLRSVHGPELTQWMSCLSSDSPKLKCHGMLVGIQQVHVWNYLLASAASEVTTKHQRRPSRRFFCPWWQLGSLRLLGCDLG